MLLNKEKFGELLQTSFKGNYSQAARAFGVTPQHIHKFMKNKGANAGAELLGGFAVFCFQQRMNFWDFIILPEHLTKVKLTEEGGVPHVANG
ncbi:MAG: hypothetical protein RIN56_07955 [Sporomusaceae bacterium]|nr:hypothetical protein [Sporomusaceae bacterium]